MKKSYLKCIVLIPLLFFYSMGITQQLGLVKDINTGTADALPSMVPVPNTILINGVFYFVADDGIHGRELWKSDGTAGGTVMLKDIYPGSPGSDISSMSVANGILFFSADDSEHGQEIWKSDGTEAGTQIVADINPGPGRGCIAGFEQMGTMNGILYFCGDDGIHGRELWKSDGTAAGTALIKDIQPGKYTTGIQAGTNRYSAPSGFAAGNGIIFFNALDELGGKGIELWKTDGTEAGTVMVKDLYSGPASSTPHDFTFKNGKLYFTAWSGSTYNLWASDGSDAGTQFIKETINDFSFNFWPTEINSDIYFSNFDGLWKTDGTSAGTVLVKSFGSQSDAISHFVNVNGTLFFIAYDDAHGYELWKSDGTNVGTELVKDINPGQDNSNYIILAKAGNKMMFCVADPAHGYELWTSDGTEAGTQIFQEIVPGPGSATAYGIWEANGTIYVTLNTPDYGTELWSNKVLLSPLPLTLLEFNGSLINDDGVLQWKTVNELNTTSFVVERSTDGRHYGPVGTLYAANADGIHFYNYTDVNIQSLGATIIYYRLRQVDMDNKFTWSRIVALSMDNKKNFAMLYPNPVRNEINLTITLARKEKLNWQLVDNNGRLVNNGYYDLSAGSTAVSVDVSKIAAGNYIMQLKGESLQQVIKVIKQ